MAKLGEIDECACGCGMLFKAREDGQRFKSKSCARRYEWAQRRSAFTPEQIDALMRAIRMEIERFMR